MYPRSDIAMRIPWGRLGAGVRFVIEIGKMSETLKSERLAIVNKGRQPVEDSDLLR